MTQVLLRSVLISLILPIIAAAQIEHHESMEKASIGITVFSMPERKFQDGSGTFSTRRTSISLLLPLTDNADGREPEGAYSQISFHGSLHLETPTISLLADEHAIYTGIFGLSDLIVADRFNNYYIFGGAGFAGDDDAMTALRWRFSGVAIGTHATSESFAFHYGLVFSYKFGRGLILPALGLRWKLAPGWAVKAVLPFSAKVEFQAADDILLGLGLKVEGDRLQFTDEGVFPGEPKPIELRLTQIELGCDIDLRISSSLLVAGEAGIAGARKMWLNSGTDDILTRPIKPAGYSKASIRFFF